jgi:hypothetical protein
MRFVVLLALIAGVAWVLLRAGRDRRLAWLERLSLPGRWATEDGAARVTLTLAGGVDGGTYEERIEDAGGTRVERGRWALSEERIVFTPEGAAAESCEFRTFDDDRIGIHGASRPKRIYRRATAGALPRR